MDVSEQEPSVRLRRLPAPTERMDVAGVPADLKRLVDDLAAQESRLILEADGTPIAAIIPLADLRRLLRLDERDRDAWEVLEAMREPFKDVAPEEIERQTARIMEEIKAENRAMREQAARSA
jgi:very-short-patch-repair endonuclease